MTNKEIKCIKSMIIRSIIELYPIDENKELKQNTDINGYWNINTKILTEIIQTYRKYIVAIDDRKVMKFIYNISYFYLIAKRSMYDKKLEELSGIDTTKKSLYSYVTHLYRSINRINEASRLTENRNYIISNLINASQFMDELEKLLNNAIKHDYRNKEDRTQDNFYYSVRMLAYNMYKYDVNNIYKLIKYSIENNLFYLFIN